MEEIKCQFTGTWIHIQDDLLPNFFDAVGATDAEKEYMLTSTPKMTFEIDGDLIKTQNTPHPTTSPDVTAMCDFKLNKEFTFEPKGVLLQITVQWVDRKMIQNITPVDSHIHPHVIEHHINNRGELVQVYKVTNTDGKEVKGTRTFRKEEES